MSSVRSLAPQRTGWTACPRQAKPPTAPSLAPNSLTPRTAPDAEIGRAASSYGAQFSGRVERCAPALPPGRRGSPRSVSTSALPPKGTSGGGSGPESTSPPDAAEKMSQLEQLYQQLPADQRGRFLSALGVDDATGGPSQLPPTSEDEEGGSDDAADMSSLDALRHEAFMGQVTRDVVRRKLGPAYARLMPKLFDTSGIASTGMSSNEMKKRLLFLSRADQQKVPKLMTLLGGLETTLMGPDPKVLLQDPHFRIAMYRAMMGAAGGMGMPQKEFADVVEKFTSSFDQHASARGLAGEGLLGGGSPEMVALKRLSLDLQDLFFQVADEVIEEVTESNKSKPEQELEEEEGDSPNQEVEEVEEVEEGAPKKNVEKVEEVEGESPKQSAEVVEEVVGKELEPGSVIVEGEKLKKNYVTEEEGDRELEEGDKPKPGSVVKEGEEGEEPKKSSGTEEEGDRVLKEGNDPKQGSFQARFQADPAAISIIDFISTFMIVEKEDGSAELTTEARDIYRLQQFIIAAENYFEYLLFLRTYVEVGRSNLEGASDLEAAPDSEAAPDLEVAADALAKPDLKAAPDLAVAADAIAAPSSLSVEEEEELRLNPDLVFADQDRLDFLVSVDVLLIKFLTELMTTEYSEETVRKWSVHPILGPRIKSGELPIPDADAMSYLVMSAIQGLDA
eukprot:gene16513-22739_t